MADLRAGRRQKRDVSRPKTTEQPSDPDWDWRQTYSAQVGETSTRFGFVSHLRVRRLDSGDGIGWDVLQRIKNDVLGSDVLAVEFYPPERQVVNDLNVRDELGVKVLTGAFIPEVKTVPPDQRLRETLEAV